MSKAERITISLDGGKPKKVLLSALIRGLPSASTSILLGLLLDDVTFGERIADDSNNSQPVLNKLLDAIGDEVDRRIPSRSRACKPPLLKRRIRVT